MTLQHPERNEFHPLGVDSKVSEELARKIRGQELEARREQEQLKRKLQKTVETFRRLQKGNSQQ